jgi:hypothetical protein
MALARCEVCGSPPGRKLTYSGKRYLPVSYPQSGIICGTNECGGQALVWLTFEEEKQYERVSVLSSCPRRPLRCRSCKVWAT